MRVPFGGLINLKIECCIVRGSFCVQLLLLSDAEAIVLEHWGSCVS